MGPRAVVAGCVGLMGKECEYFGDGVRVLVLQTARGAAAQMRGRDEGCQGREIEE